MALFRSVSYVAANSFSNQFRMKELLRVTIIIILDLHVNFLTQISNKYTLCSSNTLQRKLFLRTVFCKGGGVWRCSTFSLTNESNHQYCFNTQVCFRNRTSNLPNQAPRCLSLYDKEVLKGQNNCV